MSTGKRPFVAIPMLALAISGGVGNASVTITCQAYGENVSGHLGAGQVWDQLSNGDYLSDTYIYTSSDGLVTRLCAGSAADFQTSEEDSRPCGGPPDFQSIDLGGMDANVKVLLWMNSGGCG